MIGFKDVVITVYQVRKFFFWDEACVSDIAKSFFSIIDDEPDCVLRIVRERKHGDGKGRKSNFLKWFQEVIIIDDMGKMGKRRRGGEDDFVFCSFDVCAVIRMRVSHENCFDIIESFLIGF